MRALDADAEYIFALATEVLRHGDREGARAVAERTLRLESEHHAARQVLQAVR